MKKLPNLKVNLEGEAVDAVNWILNDEANDIGEPCLVIGQPYILEGGAIELRLVKLPPLQAEILKGVVDALVQQATRDIQ